MYDIYLRHLVLFKHATISIDLFNSRITVIFLVVISILWIPVLLSSSGGQLFVYLNSILSALGPAIFGLFFYGIFWPRINEKVIMSCYHSIRINV